MRLKFLDAILIVGILVGSVLAWRTGAERDRLKAYHARLARVAGDLPISDGTKVHILALETGEPMHFAWRVYFPPGYRQVLKSRSVGGSSSWSLAEKEFIARVRFRESNGLEVYTHFSSGSSRSTIGRPALGKFVRDHWDKIRVEQLGAHRLETLAQDGAAVVLRLELPPELREEAKGMLNGNDPVIFELRLDPGASLP